MKRKKPDQAPRPVEETMPPPEPIDVLTQHWADVTGLTRHQAANQLIKLGHMYLKQNRAGLADLQRELEARMAVHAAYTEASK